MPGRFFLTSDASDVAQFFGRAKPDPIKPRFNIAPGQEILVAAPDLAMMRWGIVPVGRVNARGRPVMETIINARSETVFSKSAFEGVRRCLVPANGWYEWTGEKRRKTAWRIRPKVGGLIAFAGVFDVWTAPSGVDVLQVATVTCPPSEDVAHIHHRMGVILRERDFTTWLQGDDAGTADLMVPFPNGSLIVEEASGVDWTAP